MSGSRTPTPEPLTERQQRILDFIRRSIREHGRPPTMREIATALGVRSTNSVKDHLRKLERKGHLRLVGEPGASGDDAGFVLQSRSDAPDGGAPPASPNGWSSGPPPHLNGPTHARIMAELREMTLAEICATSVAAGIHTAGGKLTTTYESGEDAPARKGASG